MNLIFNFFDGKIDTIMKNQDLIRQESDASPNAIPMYENPLE